MWNFFFFKAETEMTVQGPLFSTTNSLNVAPVQTNYWNFGGLRSIPRAIWGSKKRNQEKTAAGQKTLVAQFNLRTKSLFKD